MCCSIDGGNLYNPFELSWVRDYQHPLIITLHKPLNTILYLVGRYTTLLMHLLKNFDCKFNQSLLVHRMSLQLGRPSIGEALISIHLNYKLLGIFSSLISTRNSGILLLLISTQSLQCSIISDCQACTTMLLHNSENRPQIPA